MRGLICRDDLSPEDLGRGIREIFELPRDETANPAGHSNAATSAGSEESTQSNQCLQNTMTQVFAVWQMETQVHQLRSRDRDPMQPRTVPGAYC
jgi:hypothetical protein